MEMKICQHVTPEKTHIIPKTLNLHQNAPSHDKTHWGVRGGDHVMETSDLLLIKLVTGFWMWSVSSSLWCSTVLYAKSDNNNASVFVRKHDLRPYSLYKHAAVFI